MSPEAIERVVTLNMSACVAACGSLEMHPGKGAPDRAQITRVECYGNGVDDEDAAAGPMHVDHANRPLYTDMRLGHLYLQKYGHPGGPSWGLSIRGAGRGHVLVQSGAKAFAWPTYQAPPPPSLQALCQSLRLANLSGAATTVAASCPGRPSGDKVFAVPAAAGPNGIGHTISLMFCA
jgi:hypothetical protein